MFEIVGTKSLDSNAIEFTSTGINFIGRTFENNGIQGKIQKRDFEPNEPFTITATVIGNYKYVKFQKEPYYCSQNINKLSPKAIFKKWNEKIAYYLISNIQKFVSLYDGQQGGYKLEDIKGHKIQLPIKNNGIDFEFIEKFMNELESKRIKKLEEYLLSTGLNNYILTSQEKLILDNFGKINFKEHNIIEIFDVKNAQNIMSRDIVESSGEIPYLCASSANNGVSSYISYDKKYLDKGNCIFIAGKTFVVTYQEKDFYSNDSHNLILNLKDNENKNKLVQLYLVTCINKSLKRKYFWGDSISNSKIKKDKVNLPTVDGKLDYNLMATFISAVQKVLIKEIIQYSNKKLEI